MSVTEHEVGGVIILIPDETRFGALLTKGTIVDQVRAASARAERANRQALLASVAAGLPDTSRITSSQGKPPTQGPPPTPKPAPKPAQPTTLAGSGFHPAGQFYDMAIAFCIGPQTRGQAWANTITGEHGDTSQPDPALTDEEKDLIGKGYSSSIPTSALHWWCQYNVMLKIYQFRQEPRLTGFELRWTLPKTWRFTDGDAAECKLAVTSNPAVMIRTIQSPRRPQKNGKPNMQAKFPKGSVDIDVLKVYV